MCVDLSLTFFSLFCSPPIHWWALGVNRRPQGHSCSPAFRHAVHWPVAVSRRSCGALRVRVPSTRVLACSLVSRRLPQVSFSLPPAPPSASLSLLCRSGGRSSGARGLRAFAAARRVAGRTRGSPAPRLHSPHPGHGCASFARLPSLVVFALIMGQPWVRAGVGVHRTPTAETLPGGPAVRSAAHLPKKGRQELGVGVVLYVWPL